MSREKVTRSVGAALRPIAGTYRRRIKAAFLLAHGVGPLNDERRIALEDAIFQVQNDLEHRSPKHPQVAVMNAVRNVLLDDAGVNETVPGLRWPHVEAMAARMAPRSKAKAKAESEAA